MQLAYQRDAAGVRFWIEENSERVPVDQWMVRCEPASPLGRAVWVLNQLVEDDDAVEVGDEVVFLSHSQLAKLASWQADLLRLPPAVPFQLSIRGHGALTDKNFKFQWEFLRPGGLPVIAPRIEGAFVTVGRDVYRLPEPFYTIVHELEAFNADPPGSYDQRFLWWAKIKAHLGDDLDQAIVESTLISMRIELADAFSLDVASDKDGGVTFNPVLVRKRNLAHRDSSVDPSLDSSLRDAEITEELLPKVFQERFADVFRRYGDVRTVYTLGDGRYVVLTEPLRLVLSVVRAKQAASADERRRFIRNPYAAIREEVGEQLAALMAGGEALDPGEAVSQVFFEDQAFSERVLEIGLWQPKHVPWVQRPAETWLPPEEFGIKIGEKYIFIKKEDVPLVRRIVEHAIEAGEESVTINGTTIPATHDVLNSLHQIIGVITPLSEELAEGESASQVTSNPVETSKRIVLRIVDNFEVVGYRPQRVPHEGHLERLPRMLRSQLKQHQLECFNWLKRHWKSGSPGALLADDMGLGKTLQALTFLAWVREEIEAGSMRPAPILVVAPTGLLKNWMDEHDKHFMPPGLGRPLSAYGNGLRKLKKTLIRGNELQEGIAILDYDQLRAASWVLTTYETLRDYQHSFGRIRWAVIVFDEAQKIKTPGTLMTEAAKAMHAEFILTMTGTPVENRLADLWCILDTSLPGELGDLKTFSRTYEAGEDPDAGLLGKLKRRLEQSGPPHFHPPPMLRRIKDSHLQGLPPKEEVKLTASMPERQAHAYLQVLEEVRARRRSANRSGKGETLELLGRLRSVSLHPEIVWPEGVSDDQYIAASARLTSLFEKLDQVAAAGEKALIFVDYREMQTNLQSLIQRRYRLSAPPLVINGDVVGDKRKARVDEFQARRGFDVMILSPKAGGVGLTLTAANHVFHLSRWWNPAVEDQCSDRVYRIGQTKPVYIYYLIATHPLLPGRSYDERLHELLNRKRDLSRTLLAPPALTSKDLEDLLNQSVDETEGAESETLGTNADDIYTLDEVQFERWVLDQFKMRGYIADETPRSWDGGADGVALRRKPGGEDWIIQCKHHQGKKACGVEAVEEVLRAVNKYAHRVGRKLKPLVITSAPRFSSEAEKFAKQNGVHLVSAKDLGSWLDGRARRMDETHEGNGRTSADC